MFSTEDPGTSILRVKEAIAESRADDATCVASFSEPPWFRVLKLSRVCSSTLKMPINILAQILAEGLDSIPFGWTVAKIAPVCVVLYLLKWYFNGASNLSERKMHSKVVMVTVRWD